MNLTDIFVHTLFTLNCRPLPQNVEEEARRCLLDEVGVIFAGAKQLEEKLGAYLDLFSGDDATVIGMNRRASLQNAALVNGISGHALDFDDSHRFSTVHLGSTIIPAVLAVAEKEDLTMAQVLRGIVIGYEAAVRMGNCIQPNHRTRGFHSSGTVGTIGATMGVAAALGFNKEQFKSALSSACSSAAGILEMMNDASTMKPYNAGRAAHDGITAAYMARVGFQGPDDCLGGDFGFIKTACEKYKPEVLSLETDDNFNITGTYHKPYASCRHTHGAVFAAIRAVNDNGVDWRHITNIDVRMYGQGVKGHDHTDIPSTVAAKMSTPFCIALALKTGKIGISSFTDEFVKDPEILALTKKVVVTADEEMTSFVPKKRMARITITTDDGTKYPFQADYALGEPELPMSHEDFRTKILELAASAGRNEADTLEVIEKAMSFTGKASEFIKLLA